MWTPARRPAWRRKADGSAAGPERREVHTWDFRNLLNSWREVMEELREGAAALTLTENTSWVG